MARAEEQPACFGPLRLEQILLISLMTLTGMGEMVLLQTQLCFRAAITDQRAQLGHSRALPSRAWQRSRSAPPHIFGSEKQRVKNKQMAGFWNLKDVPSQLSWRTILTSLNYTVLCPIPHTVNMCSNSTPMKRISTAPLRT
ncbi:hypothetical protein AAFF_G00280310 [Aldrovandia affinis]|uniref:Uncharacterized protein n=1 Tax=Aldrovandia affinis TaxID=143900 RepID=A0AAD7RA27_9TELE|nr:hypothetical protein AAFF_G00280310 [Aldrovandia affinis]